MANETSLTETFGPLLTSTTRNLFNSGMPYDQIFKSSALLEWLYKGKRIKKVTGGERIAFNLVYETNPSYTP
jgi:hypothetical protein